MEEVILPVLVTNRFCDLDMRWQLASVVSQCYFSVSWDLFCSPFTQPVLVLWVIIYSNIIYPSNIILINTWRKWHPPPWWLGCHGNLHWKFFIFFLPLVLAGVQMYIGSVWLSMSVTLKQKKEKRKWLRHWHKEINALYCMKQKVMIHW